MEGEKSADITSFKVDAIISLPPEQIKQMIPPFMKKIASRRARNLLVMFYPETTSVSMEARDTSQVFFTIKDADSSKGMDLLIHSGGGDIHTAYKLAKLCQKKFSNIKALIPEYAKSAATLLAIGCHELEMSPIAELGPLDPIIGFENGSTYPAFAIRDSTRVLEKEIEECKDKDVRRLKAEHVLGPIAAKIDPYVLSEMSDMPTLAIAYGKKLLTSTGYGDEVAERILKRLTYERGRPSHAYVIDVDEAKEIGLRVKEMDKETEEECLALLMFLRLCERKMCENGHPPKLPLIYVSRPEKTEKVS